MIRAFGTIFLNMRGDLFDGFDAVVNKENLPVSREFEFDRRFYDAFGKLNDLRIYRQTVARRSFDDGHIAHSEKRHIQSSRNRRCAEESKHRLFSSTALIFLCARHRIFVLRQRRPRPIFGSFTSFDKMRCVPIKISTSPFSAFSTTSFCSFFERKRDNKFDLYGKSGKSLFESFEMLVSENRRRR